jgi:hypothetical protein
VAVVSQVVEWFWQRSAERAVQAAGQGASPRVLELTARSVLAREAAARTLRPPEPFSQPGNEALACELYRQAIHWALLAHDALGGEVTAATTAGATPASDLASLLDRVDASLLSRAAGGDAELAALRRELGSATYREFAELPASEQQSRAELLEAFCLRVSEPLEARRQRLERIWVRRVTRLLGLCVVLAGVVWGARAFAGWRERSNDLAPKATWTASSNYPQGGCKSPEQQCAGGENYFFHTTQETNPWVQFDLHKKREVSGVEIDNRLDCCTDRANPIVVEVSNDQRKWRQVARHSGEFTTLRLKFATVQARYVRLVVPKQAAILHLSKVRIFP